MNKPLYILIDNREFSTGSAKTGLLHSTAVVTSIDSAFIEDVRASYLEMKWTHDARVIIGLLQTPRFI